MNSEIMLKLFLRQQQRMEVMTELEDNMKVRFPDGYKRVSAVRAIAAEVRKLEVGEQWMRGKCGNMPYVHELEDDPEEMSPLAKELLQFDEVDRSLLCELTARVIELAQEKARGRFKAVGPESDAGTERGAAEAVDEGEFDEVYRSTLREVTAQVIELAQEKASGRSKAVGLEGDAGAERGAAEAADEGAVQPPVSEGP